MYVVYVYPCVLQLHKHESHQSFASRVLASLCKVINMSTSRWLDAVAFRHFLHRPIRATFNQFEVTSFEHVDFKNLQFKGMLDQRLRNTI